jgi:hypothetical protein
VRQSIEHPSLVKQASLAEGLQHCRWNWPKWNKHGVAQNANLGNEVTLDLFRQEWHVQRERLPS